MILMNIYDSDSDVSTHIVGSALSALDRQLYTVVKSTPESQYTAHHILYGTLYRTVRDTIEFSILNSIRNHMRSFTR